MAEKEIGKTSPPQPTQPPKGKSPSPSIQQASDTSWDGWHGHGNKDPKAALADKHTSKPLDPAKPTSVKAPKKDG